MPPTNDDDQSGEKKEAMSKVAWPSPIEEGHVRGQSLKLAAR
jgi:hypothetical protein